MYIDVFRNKYEQNRQHDFFAQHKMDVWSIATLDIHGPMVMEPEWCPRSVNIYCLASRTCQQTRRIKVDIDT